MKKTQKKKLPSPRTIKILHYKLLNSLDTLKWLDDYSKRVIPGLDELCDKLEAARVLTDAVSPILQKACLLESHFSSDDTVPVGGYYGNLDCIAKERMNPNVGWFNGLIDRLKILWRGHEKEA